MLTQTLLGEAEGTAGGVTEGEKQQKRKHSGVQNETTHMVEGDEKTEL